MRLLQIFTNLNFLHSIVNEIKNHPNLDILRKYLE